MISRHELIDSYGKLFWKSLSREEQAWIEGSNGLPVNGRLPNDPAQRQKIRDSAVKKLTEEQIRKSKKGRG